MRFLFFPFILLARIFGWIGRALFLVFRGYNVVHLKLRGSLPDRHHAQGLLAALSRPSRGPTLLDVLLALDRARRDPRVKAVFVEVGRLSCGLARAEEIRDALARVQESGRPVWLFAEEMGLTEYLLALGASKVVLAPAGGLALTGVASEVTFLKGLLDKAGVKAQLAARGKYKSARELFAEPSMSEANREMTGALVGDLYEQAVSQIARARKLSEAGVRSRLDEGPFLAREAVGAALVDAAGYAGDLEEDLKKQFPKYRPVGLSSYLDLSTPVAKKNRKGRPTPVAILEVIGHIKGGRSLPGADGSRATGSRTFLKQLESAAKDPAVKAIVLRVDSPGGSALASDLMWHELKKAQEKKPVVVSMSNVAASGGYYVSALPQAPIFCCEATITGSIGVLGGKFSLAGLYEKLGIKKETISRGRRAAFHSASSDFTEGELAKLEADIDAFYKDFVTKMAQGRAKPYEAIHEVAQGRVWTGRQALGNGLADRRGGMLEALAQVRKSLSLPEEAPLGLLFPEAEKARWPIRIEWNFQDRAVESLEEVLGAGPLRLLRLARLFAGERVLAILPFEMDWR